MKEVTIYTTPTCHYCHMAMEFFDENKVKYTRKDVVEDMAARQEMVEKSGQLGVPVIDIGGSIVVGYNKDVIEELLELKK